MATLKDKFEAATEKVVQAKHALAEAEKERDAIYKMIAVGKPKKMQAGDSALVVMPTSADPQKDSATDRIMGVILSQPDKVFAYEDFFKALPDVPKPTVRALLFKLRSEGKTKKEGRGKWKSAA